MYSKKERLKLLVKIADILDRDDEEEAADFVDSMIEEESLMPDDLTIEVPNEELDELRTIHDALGDSLE